MMTKKDYELIAATIKTAQVHNAERMFWAEIFTDALATTSPKFDRDRFLRACQPESGRVER